MDNMHPVTSYSMYKCGQDQCASISIGIECGSILLSNAEALCVAVGGTTAEICMHCSCTKLLCCCAQVCFACTRSSKRYPG